MSVLTGIVDAPFHKVFETYAGAEAFIAKLGPRFEGIQVREESYIVNYF